MSFNVTVLGCSGVYQTRDLAASGFLIEIDGGHWLIDMGGGTWRNLMSHMDYRDLDGVFLTHRHPDHTSTSGSSSTLASTETSTLPRTGFHSGRLRRPST